MYKLYINDEFDIVCKDDFPTLVEEHMGRDAAKIVKDLVKESYFNEHKLNSDLVYYESELTDYKYWAGDVQGIVNELLKYLKEAKRINRNKLKELVNNIGALTNQILQGVIIYEMSKM